ncbi:unnamed protein product [Pleuronectes platessa]|uniref:Uncharacterized protein n=1 Tax=Pleuronectes platessa TaxID=8262 RepID=A0A9N7W4Y5_PLEPL|nr:unnamed protein product [Pleuronectes platessa]
MRHLIFTPPHEHHQCLSAAADTFPVWTRRDRRRSVRARRQRGDKRRRGRPASHDTEPLCRKLPHDATAAATWASQGIIRAGQSRVRRLTPTYLGNFTVTNHGSADHSLLEKSTLSYFH